MNIYLTENEKIKGEEVVIAIPYKPFSILIITNKRVIGKRLLRVGPKRFESAISYDQIDKVEFIPAKLLFRVPSIILSYRALQGRCETIVIRLPGFSSRLAGFNPEAIVEEIKKRVEKAKEEFGSN